jgi:hypothetical protein
VKNQDFSFCEEDLNVGENGFQIFNVAGKNLYNNNNKKKKKKKSGK